MNNVCGVQGPSLTSPEKKNLKNQPFFNLKNHNFCKFYLLAVFFYQLMKQYQEISCDFPCRPDWIKAVTKLQTKWDELLKISFFQHQHVSSDRFKALERKHYKAIQHTALNIKQNIWQKCYIEAGRSMSGDC